MKTTNEKVAYLELAEHKYVHITDKCLWENDRAVGPLSIEVSGQIFEPAMWNFAPAELENGVHLLEDLEIELHPNFGQNRPNEAETKLKFDRIHNELVAMPGDRR